MIRLATSADAAGIHAIYAPIVRDTAISFELEAPEVPEIARRIHGSSGRIARASPDMRMRRSIALHEAVGFDALGQYRAAGYKLGAWRDVVWLQCPLGDLPANPPTPRRLPELPPEALDAVLRGS